MSRHETDDLGVPGVDPETPSSARAYDYYLGGSHNFAVDRARADQLAAAVPGIPAAARANRSFLRRAVRFVARSGIRQFLDLGSGIPSVGNVHEVADQVEPHSRVVYVDQDPVAAAYCRALAVDGRIAGLRADLRDPAAVLGAHEVGNTLDLTEPVAILLVSVLHFIPREADAAALIAAYRDAVPAGSALIVSLASQEHGEETTFSAGTRSVNVGLCLRDRREVEQLFTGFELVDPGLVRVPEWRPDESLDSNAEALELPSLAGTGIKR